MKRIITAIVLVITLALAVGYYFINKSDPLGGVSNVAGSTYTLAGSGMSSTATSFTLTSFTIPQNGYAITDGDISDTFYLTIEPGSRSRQEIISCTTVTQNAGGTATISGCTRGLSPIAPYTASTSLQFSHPGGSQVILSNPPQFYEQFGALANDETITGNWYVPTPLAATQIASKGYVDSVVNGGELTLDNIAVGATAGDTFATGTIVYFDAGGSNRWEKASAAASSTSANHLIGVAQGAGVDGESIDGGVLTRGYDTTNTGGTAGQIIYLSDTAGATSTTAGTLPIKLGIVRSTGAIYFDPVQLQYANLGSDNDFKGKVTFEATADAGVSGIINEQIFTANGTWTKPYGAKSVRAILIGGGGGGGSLNGISSSFNGAGGGGGGGLVIYDFDADSLDSTEDVYVGVGGTGGVAGTSPANGSDGTDSTFAGLTAEGGKFGVGGQSGTAGPGGTSSPIFILGVVNQSGGSLSECGAGGAGGSSNGTAGYACTFPAPTGGGGSSGHINTNVYASGAGGSVTSYFTWAGAAAATGGSSPGNPGYTVSSTSIPFLPIGIGGSGAVSSVSGGIGADGGDGGNYGGGGGGGGPCRNTGTCNTVDDPGDGGDGGDGVVILITYR